MLERSFLAIPLITAFSPVTKSPLPSVYVIVTLPLASTVYSLPAVVAVICFSSARLATLFTVVLPGVLYVMRSPSLLITVSPVPLGSFNVISLVIALSVVTLLRSLRSFANANSTVAPALSLVCLTVKFLPAIISTVLVSAMFFAVASWPVASAPPLAVSAEDLMFQEDFATVPVLATSTV